VGDDELTPLAPKLGGGPYNVAVALGRLDVPTRFLSRVSSDHFGEQLVKRLHASNVGTDLVQRGPENTTLAVVGLADDGSARYSRTWSGSPARSSRRNARRHHAITSSSRVFASSSSAGSASRPAWSST